MGRVDFESILPEGRIVRDWLQSVNGSRANWRHVSANHTHARTPIRAGGRTHTNTHLTYFYLFSSALPVCPYLLCQSCPAPLRTQISVEVPAVGQWEGSGRAIGACAGGGWIDLLVCVLLLGEHTRRRRRKKKCKSAYSACVLWLCVCVPCVWCKFFTRLRSSHSCEIPSFFAKLQEIFCSLNFFAFPLSTHPESFRALWTQTEG